jgi:hypothetical protein
MGQRGLVKAGLQRGTVQQQQSVLHMWMVAAAFVLCQVLTGSQLLGHAWPCTCYIAQAPCLLLL